SSRRLRLRVIAEATEWHAVPAVRAAARRGAAVSTGESAAYRRLSWGGDRHAAGNHSREEGARGDDRDGLPEVHCNNLEGNWTGLRNFLRPFRGVNEVYLVMFECSYNTKCVTAAFLRALTGARTRITRYRT